MNWLKYNWKALTWLISSAAVMAAMVTFILLKREDRGFMEKDFHTGKPIPCGQLQWDKTAFPIPVVLEGSDAPKITKEVSFAIAFWNGSVGFEMFSAGGTRKPFDEQARGTVLVEAVSDGSMENHGRTLWKAEDGPGRCRIISMHVKVPGLIENRVTRNKVMAHELGHALGLEHDDYEQSVMYFGGKAIRWGLNEVTDQDRQLLKATYQ